MVAHTRRCNVVGPARDALTTADRQLTDQLAARGYQVTPHQLKRWRAAGLLPPPSQQARGRGPGRRSTAYPEGSAERAEAIAYLLAQHVPLRYIALVLFTRSFPIDEKRLTVAYAQFLDDIEALAYDEHDPSDGADRLAQHLRRRAKRVPLGRRWIARGNTYGARRGSLLEAALVTLTSTVFADARPDEQAGQAVSQIVGAPAELAGDLAARLQLTTLPALRATLGELAPGELVRARDLLTRSLSVTAQLQHLTVSITGEAIAEGLSDRELVDELGHALGILSMAAVLRGLPGYEHALEQLESLLTGTTAPEYEPAPLHSETQRE